MSRPAAVTASAILALLGSLFALLLAVFSVGSLFIATPQPRAPDDSQYAAVGGVLFTALGAIGVRTAVGLFRLRSWARRSILVFAGFLATVSLFAIVTIMTMPMAPDMPAEMGANFRPVMVIIAAIPLVIAVWWLIQFNTQSTKAAFANATEESVNRRPLIVTVIAWFAILTGVGNLYAIVTRTPAFLFGAIFTGWTAVAIYAFFAAVSFYIGKGLLDLRERARVVAVAWFALSLVHWLLIAFLPPLQKRVVALQATLAPDERGMIPFGQGMRTNATLGLITVMGVTAIWYLIRNRAAFAQRALSPREGP